MEDPNHQHAVSVTAGSVGSVNSQQNCSGGQTKGYASIPSHSPLNIGSVDLCDACQIIWMNRVRSLTQASEP